MARGIENTRLFRTDEDRTDFLRRLATQVETSGAQVFAWALLPNHLHLLLRTGQRPLASVMRRLLTGYAHAFNRRHRRHGHLFQNRYRSIVVEDDPYLLELTRYIHLNPLRAGCVRSLRALDRYPWAGHSALLGHVARPWQAVPAVLGQFAERRRVAQRRYRAFVAAGIGQGRRPELQGGGLRRSAGGWTALAALPRGRERWAFDERILGSGPFVEQLLREAERAVPLPGRAAAWRTLPVLITRVATALGVNPQELRAGSRLRPVARARAAAGALAVRHLGLPASGVAAALGVTSMAIFRGMNRGLAALRAHGLDPVALVKGSMKQVD
jgi:REP element-mobilizing transposase RayT